MHRIVLVTGFLFGMFGMATAQGADIEATIGNQIEAFKADDFAEAFSYASPNIQALFQTPETFGRMVAQGYPMVWRPAEVRYLELREVAGTFLQQVMITDTAGATHILEYQMQELEGGWKINGVQIVKAPGSTA